MERHRVHLTKDASYRMTVMVGTGAPLRDASFDARSIEGEDWHSLAHKTAELVHGKRVDQAKWFALIGTIDREHPDSPERTVADTGGR